MAFHYAYAKKMFDAYWETKSLEMKKAGMSDDDIKKMYEFDWACFRKARILSDWEQDTDPKIQEDLIDSVGREWEAEGHFDFLQEINDDRLLSCMKKLSPDERKLLALRYEKCLDFSEIAKVLGVHMNAVYQRHSRLLRQIRRYMKQR